MSGGPGPTSTETECASQYRWNPHGDKLVGRGRQATYITLVQKQKQKKDTDGSKKELFVCKWYATAGVEPNKIGGWKYIYREWKTLSSVRHANIVAYEDFSYSSRPPRLAKLYMEYCPGGDLARFEKTDSDDYRLEYHEGLQVLEQIAQALLYIHHGVCKVGKQMTLAPPVAPDAESEAKDSQWTPILHRDIKPENNVVLIASRGEHGIVVKLGDFGVSRFDTDGTQTYVGTRHFLAPEQRASNHDPRRTTIKSDIYSLGVTIKRIIKLDEVTSEDGQADSTARNSRLALQSLLDLMTDKADSVRPSSSSVIEVIQGLGTIASNDSTMCSEVVSAILEFEASSIAYSSRKKDRRKARNSFTTLLEIFCRLHRSGLDPEDSHIGGKSLLDCTTEYLGFYRRLSEMPSASGQAVTCPQWKIEVVEVLVPMLRKSFAERLEREIPEVEALIVEEEERERAYQAQKEQTQSDQTQMQRALKMQEPDNIVRGEMPLTADMRVELLERSQNAWIAPILLDHSLSVHRQVEAAFDKMTLPTFEQTSGQILEIVNQSSHEADARMLRLVVQVTFERACDCCEAEMTDMYAKFYGKLRTHTSHDIHDAGCRTKDGDPIAGRALAKKYILNTCQMHFEQTWPKYSLDNGIRSRVFPRSDEDSSAFITKQRRLPFLKFVGQLYKQEFFTLRILHECVMTLCQFSNTLEPDGAGVEELVIFLRSIGGTMHKDEKGAALLNTYFERLDTHYLNDANLPSTSKSMIQDLIKFRKAGWESGVGLVEEDIAAALPTAMQLADTRESV